MKKFDEYVDTVIEEGKIVLKRRYTENYPEKSVRHGASVRNKIIEALRDKKLTLSEFNELISNHSKSPTKWTQRNKRFFKIEEDSVTLSSYGNKILSGLEPVNEEEVNEKRKPITKKHWDKASDDQKEAWLLSVFSDPDDALEYVESDWEDLPDEATSNMYESVNENKSQEKKIHKWLSDHGIQTPDSIEFDYTFTDDGGMEFDVKIEKGVVTLYDGEEDTTMSYKEFMKDFMSESKSINEAKVKPFKKVKPGDIAVDYNDHEMMVYKTGKIGKLMKWDDSGAAEDGLEQGYLDKNDDAIVIEDPLTHGYAVYTYGEEGAVVYESIENTNREIMNEEKVECTKCDGKGCDHCDNTGYHIVETSTIEFARAEEVVLDFKSYVNEEYLAEEVEAINEKLKSSKLRSLIGMRKSPKDLLKAMYGSFKINLAEIGDEQIIDTDPSAAFKTQNDGKKLIFYFTQNAKDNPYADTSGYSNTKIPANTLLAVASGKKFFYIKTNYIKGNRNYALTTQPKTYSYHTSTDMIGVNKEYKGWDASGLGSVKRVVDVADRAFVINIDAIEKTTELTAARDEAKAGAIALKDAKKIAEENMARYKKIISDRLAANMDVDKEVKKAIDTIAKKLTDAVNAPKDQNGIVIGKNKKGRPYYMRDLTNFTNNIFDAYEKFSRAMAQVERVKNKKDLDKKSIEWEVKYELKNAAKYRDEVNDYLKKLKAENLGW